MLWQQNEQISIASIKQKKYLSIQVSGSSLESKAGLISSPAPVQLKECSRMPFSRIRASKHLKIVIG